MKKGYTGMHGQQNIKKKKILDIQSSLFGSNVINACAVRQEYTSPSC